jgi:tRNA(Ile2) C34 agmatinyltransferase TiaS
MEMAQSYPVCPQCGVTMDPEFGGDACSDCGYIAPQSDLWLDLKHSAARNRALYEGRKFGEYRNINDRKGW